VGLSRKSAEVPSLEAEVPSLATWLVNVRSPVAAAACLATVAGRDLRTLVSGFVEPLGQPSEPARSPGDALRNIGLVLEAIQDGMREVEELRAVWNSAF
jgi:hypothetical protein